MNNNSNHCTCSDLTDFVDNLLIIAIYVFLFSVGNKISSPIVLEHFVVMDDYKKQAKSDISLKKGKSVDVIEKRECGKSITITLFNRSRLSLLSRKVAH